MIELFVIYKMLGALYLSLFLIIPTIFLVNKKLKILNNLT